MIKNNINRMNKRGGFVDYPVNLLFIALFVIAIITFGTLLANEYSMDSEDMYGASMGVDNLVDNLEEELNDSYRESLIMKNKTLESDISLGSTVAIVLGMFGTIVKAFGIIPKFFNLLINLVINVLGIPEVVFWTISAIFIIGIVFAAFRLVMTGK